MESKRKGFHFVRVCCACFCLEVTNLDRAVLYLYTCFVLFLFFGEGARDCFVFTV